MGLAGVLVIAPAYHAFAGPGTTIAVDLARADAVATVAARCRSDAGSCLLVSSADARPIVHVGATAEDYLELADATEALLRKDVLDVWFPRAIDDDNRGFHSEFSREWRPTPGKDGKFSVFQAARDASGRRRITRGARC